MKSSFACYLLERREDGEDQIVVIIFDSSLAGKKIVLPVHEDM